MMGQIARPARRARGDWFRAVIAYHDGQMSEEGSTGRTSVVLKRRTPSAVRAVALAVAIVTLLTAGTAALLTRNSGNAVCVQVKFPPESPPNEEFAFAAGVTHAAPSVVESGYSGVKHAVAIRLGTKRDAARLQMAVDKLPLLLIGLGTSTTSVVMASVVNCHSVEDMFGRCEPIAEGIRCRL